MITLNCRTYAPDEFTIFNESLHFYKTHPNILNPCQGWYEDIALNTIAFKADGSVRDSLSILDRIISYSGQLISYDLVKESLGIIEDKVYLDLLNYIITSDQSSILIKIKEVINSGYSIDNFISGFNTFLSNCLMVISGYSNKDFINDETAEWIKQNKEHINSVDIMRIIEQVQDYELKSKNLLQPNIALESLFVKLSVMDESVKISDLLANIPSDNSVKVEYSNNSIKVEPKKEDSCEQKIESNKVIDENSNLEVEHNSSNIKAESTKEESPVVYQKEDFEKQWIEIIKLIDSSDKRISNILDDAKVYLDSEIIVIDLGETDNSYIQKTLQDNQDLIQKSAFEITNHKFNVEIKSKIKVEDEEKEHPLLNDIKTKFSGGNNI